MAAPLSMISMILATSKMNLLALAVVLICPEIMVPEEGVAWTHLTTMTSTKDPGLLSILDMEVTFMKGIMPGLPLDMEAMIARALEGVI